MEAAVEVDEAGAHLSHARHVLDALGDFVPCAVVFVGGGISWGGDGLVAEDERVEGDDFAVGVEDVDGELAGDEARDGSNNREGFFFPQHVELCFASSFLYDLVISFGGQVN